MLRSVKFGADTNKYPTRSTEYAVGSYHFLVIDNNFQKVSYYTDNEPVNIGNFHFCQKIGKIWLKRRQYDHMEIKSYNDKLPALEIGHSKYWIHKGQKFSSREEYLMYKATI